MYLQLRLYMKVSIYFLIFGLSGAGSFFAKELARFLGTCQDEHFDSTMFLLDEEDVTESDVMDSSYLPQDIGWNRAGVMQGALSVAYPRLTVSAFAKGADSASVDEFMASSFGYDHKDALLVVYDFSDKGLDKKGRTLFEKRFRNILLIRPQKQEVNICSKLAEIGKISEGKSVKISKRAGMGKNLEVSHICMAVATQLYENHLMLNDIPCMAALDKAYGRRFCKKNDSWLVVCVGTGGTGGNFCKEFPHLMLKKEGISLLMIDGDRVEAKNTKRQPYGKRDIMQNKADILKKDLLIDYPMLGGRLFSWPHYLDDVADLEKAIVSADIPHEHVLLIGGVDNHAARRVMQRYHESKADSIYVDSANEWSNGEVVCSVRVGGIDQSPVRSFFFPNILTDTSPSASEISCGAINESAPQHQVTNLTAAQNIFTCIEPVLTHGVVYGGIVYFDAFKGFARFQPVNREMLREAAYG